MLKEAIAAYRNAIGFADALRVAGASEANVAAFATFDKELQQGSAAISKSLRVIAA